MYMKVRLKGTMSMSAYICESCHKIYTKYQDLQHIDSILEVGICCECREDAAFCTQCNMYYFNSEAHYIMQNESELCPTHYQQHIESIMLA